jgi:hypothetical protein
LADTPSASQAEIARKFQVFEVVPTAANPLLENAGVGGRTVVATTAAVVVFWRSAFFVQGDKQNAAQLAQLKGDMNAIQQESIAKNCGIQFQTVRPRSRRRRSTGLLANRRRQR